MENLQIHQEHAQLVLVELISRWGEEMVHFKSAETMEKSYRFCMFNPNNGVELEYKVSVAESPEAVADGIDIGYRPVYYYNNPNENLFENTRYKSQTRAQRRKIKADYNRAMKNKLRSRRRCLNKKT